MAKEAALGRKLPKGHGRGIAAHYSFTTYVAAVIEAPVVQGQHHDSARDIAIDCGAAVNPDRVRAQLEGACIMGLSNASRRSRTRTAASPQDNFHQYEVMRMNAAPKEIHMHVITPAYEMPLGGVGEPGVPPVAPALTNAIFAPPGNESARCRSATSYRHQSDRCNVEGPRRRLPWP